MRPIDPQLEALHVAAVELLTRAYELRYTQLATDVRGVDHSHALAEWCRDDARVSAARLAYLTDPTPRTLAELDAAEIVRAISAQVLEDADCWER